MNNAKYIELDEEQPLLDSLGLGVTTKKRSSLLPAVPTIAEAGVAGFDYPIWYGVWVPAGTPTEVVDKLAKDIARVLAAPSGKETPCGCRGIHCFPKEPHRQVGRRSTRFIGDPARSRARPELMKVQLKGMPAWEPIPGVPHL
jgi:Tripartite tricarboxylate transporter family receptor